ncbi:MAG: hypothetical protein DRH37_00950 [Deltaproteobacteria bacterium]|nr:MAG: hypothetical protein DRH37_00950 [Deltaproteobacteria bacterium]
MSGIIWIHNSITMSPISSAISQFHEQILFFRGKTMQNHYGILGVSKNADLDKIKKAYRTEVKKHHPDITRDPKNRKRFLEITEAYETLSDEAKRQEYDAELRRKRLPRRSKKSPDKFHTWTHRLNTTERVFFEGSLPGSPYSDRRAITGDNLYLEAILSPREAVQGGSYHIRIPVLEPCPRCGEYGVLDSFLCPFCNGYGTVCLEREFPLNIPPNVSHGTEMKLSLTDFSSKNMYVTVVVYIDPNLETF